MKTHFSFSFDHEVKLVKVILIRKCYHICYLLLPSLIFVVVLIALYKSDIYLFWTYPLLKFLFLSSTIKVVRNSLILISNDLMPPKVDVEYQQERPYVIDWFVG